MAGSVKAPKNGKIEQNNVLKENKKSKKPIIIIAIILLLFIAGIIIYFNIGNLTEKYVKPSLEKIPIVNNLIVKDYEEDKYDNLEKEDLIVKIEELENLLNQKEELIDISQNTIEKLENEIERLKEIEENQIQYKEDKQKFDEMVALQEPSDFMSFYKEMYPDTAAEIYEKLLSEDKQTKDIKNYSEPFQDMDPSDAAEVFEEMINTDMDLVVLILKNIDSEQQAAIIGEMTPAEAAKVVKSMAP